MPDSASTRVQRRDCKGSSGPQRDPLAVTSGWTVCLGHARRESFLDRNRCLAMAHSAQNARLRVSKPGAIGPPVIRWLSEVMC